MAKDYNAKRRAQEIDIENQRNEEERTHEKRMIMLMMTFLHQSNVHSSSQKSVYHFFRYPCAPDDSFMSCSNPTADTDVDYNNQVNQ